MTQRIAKVKAPDFSIACLPVLWEGTFSTPEHPFLEVKVLAENGQTLTLLSEHNVIMTGVKADLVRRNWYYERTTEVQPPPVCADCGHFFDPTDKRAFVHVPSERYPDLGHCCPACHQMARGAEAWAVWNGCQGVFTDAVFDSRAEAEKVQGEDPECFEKVVPVRVLIEPEVEHDLRKWKERV